MLLAYTGVFKTLPDEKLYYYKPTRFVSLSKVRYGSILTSLQVIVQVLPRLELTAPNINAVSDLIIRKLSKILSCKEIPAKIIA